MIDTTTTAQILSGKEFAAAILADVEAEVRGMTAAGHRQPALAAVLVGGDPASKVYVNSKVKGCHEVGMASRAVLLPETTSEAEILRTLQELNEDDAVDGILVQLPLPKGIHERRVVESVLPEKDVDGFHPENVGRLWLDQEGLAPATPAGIMELLRRMGIPLAGQRAVIVGRSSIVGKPMAGLLLREHCTVTVCHSRTRDLAAITREADILVAAIGRPAMLGAEHVKEGAVVVDVGINRIHDRAEVERLFPGDAERMSQFEKRGSTLVGDVDFTQVLPKVAAITPVPGGVGPLTVAMVIGNTLKAAKRRQGLS
jgi:methylenetetrahydrofolate dehydrogenase (NADP+)/methenyltetrahydrofolate cyclohydrolase